MSLIGGVVLRRGVRWLDAPSREGEEGGAGLAETGATETGMAAAVVSGAAGAATALGLDFRFGRAGEPAGLGFRVGSPGSAVDFAFAVFRAALRRGGTGLLESDPDSETRFERFGSFFIIVAH